MVPWGSECGDPAINLLSASSHEFLAFDRATSGCHGIHVVGDASESRLSVAEMNSRRKFRALEYSGRNERIIELEM